MMKALQRTTNVESKADSQGNPVVTVIEVGEVVPDDHPLVKLHPHMFEPAAG